MSERGRTINKRERSIGRLVSGLVVGGVLATVAVLMLGTTAPPAQAWFTRCDFLTGGGWILYNGNQGTFGVGGGCKFGSTTWGHLEYQDHGPLGLNVHATSITAYFPEGDTLPDSKTGQPTGTRHICGTARTNLYGDVFFHVRARDAGEPGVNDQFDLRLCPSLNQACGPNYLYDTTNQCFPHFLGSSAPCSAGNGGGGNIQLHKPNASTTGDFNDVCPQF